jgi:hypothetical protein
MGIEVPSVIQLFIFCGVALLIWFILFFTLVYNKPYPIVRWNEDKQKDEHFVIYPDGREVCTDKVKQDGNKKH